MTRFIGRSFFPLAILVAVGCDNGSTAQMGESSSAPPRLLRVMAQPLNRSCTRCRVTDLLDTRPPPACAVDRPCPVAFQVMKSPPPTCQLDSGATTGVCTDPLAAAPVGLGGADEGNAFRLVFSHLLDPALDDVSMDASGNTVTTLKSGIVEIDGPQGAPLQVAAFFDPGGSASTFDAVVAPFGPAIEVDLVDPLAPNTTYAIKLDSSRTVDSAGHLPADAAGVPLPSPYSLSFTTEPSLKRLKVTPDISGAADASKMTPSIAPDDVIQLLFAAPVADPMVNGSTTTVTLTSGGTSIPVEVWRDQGAPGSCKGNSRQLDIVAVSAPGMPAMLTAGAYTLAVSGVVDGIYGNAQPYSASFDFFVAGMPSAKDPSAASKFYIPGAGACQ